MIKRSKRALYDGLLGCKLGLQATPPYNHPATKSRHTQHFFHTSYIILKEDGTSALIRRSKYTILIHPSIHPSIHPIIHHPPVDTSHSAPMLDTSRPYDRGRRRAQVNLQSLNAAELIVLEKKAISSKNILTKSSNTWVFSLFALWTTWMLIGAFHTSVFHYMTSCAAVVCGLLTFQNCCVLCRNMLL